MQKLNLPSYNFNIKSTENNKTQIFDNLRRKFVSLTPEEWVRQNFIKYLIEEKNFPQGLIAVEYAIAISNNTHRSDIVCFDKKGKARLIVECKAPSIKITQEVFEQAARYNMNLKTDYLILTNGLSHYCCKVNYTSKSVEYLKEIPEFNELNSFLCE